MRRQYNSPTRYEYVTPFKDALPNTYWHVLCGDQMTSTINVSEVVSTRISTKTFCHQPPTPTQTTRIPISNLFYGSAKYLSLITMALNLLWNSPTFNRPTGTPLVLNMPMKHYTLAPWKWERRKSHYSARHFLHISSNSNEDFPYGHSFSECLIQRLLRLLYMYLLSNDDGIIFIGKWPLFPNHCRQNYKWILLFFISTWLLKNFAPYTSHFKNGQS